MSLVPKFDPEWIDVLGNFISHRVRIAGATGVVIGISGGLDSAVVAALCVRALGKDRVLGVMMPDKKPAPEAPLCIDWLGIESRLLPIWRMLDAVECTASAATGKVRETSKSAPGNIKARSRMTLLYLFANRMNRLVAGTGNKSELLTGYFTKYGDGGVDLLPIGDLYKTQVRELATALDVPEKIRALVPTAGLYPGQTDEGELGISYDNLDRILMGIEIGQKECDISKKAGVPLAEVRRITRRVQSSIHKRQMPPIPKLGIRTIGLDWREEAREAID